MATHTDSGQLSLLPSSTHSGRVKFSENPQSVSYRQRKAREAGYAGYENEADPMQYQETGRGFNSRAPYPLSSSSSPPHAEMGSNNHKGPMRMGFPSQSRAEMGPSNHAAPMRIGFNNQGPRAEMGSRTAGMGSSVNAPHAGTPYDDRALHQQTGLYGDYATAAADEDPLLHENKQLQLSNMVQDSDPMFNSEPAMQHEPEDQMPWFTHKEDPNRPGVCSIDKGVQATVEGATEIMPLVEAAFGEPVEEVEQKSFVHQWILPSPLKEDPEHERLRLDIQLIQQQRDSSAKLLDAIEQHIEQLELTLDHAQGRIIEHRQHKEASEGFVHKVMKNWICCACNQNPADLKTVEDVGANRIESRNLLRSRLENHSTDIAERDAEIRSLRHQLALLGGGQTQALNGGQQYERKFRDKDLREMKLRRITAAMEGSNKGMLKANFLAWRQVVKHKGQTDKILKHGLSAFSGNLAKGSLKMAFAVWARLLVEKKQRAKKKSDYMMKRYAAKLFAQADQELLRVALMSWWTETKNSHAERHHDELRKSKAGDRAKTAAELRKLDSEKKKGSCCTLM